MSDFEVREKGESDNFYGQHCVGARISANGKEVNLYHFRSLHGSCGCGIPHNIGFAFPSSMAKEIGEALLAISGAE
jgi:hypothetical protein